MKIFVNILKIAGVVVLAYFGVFFTLGILDGFMLMSDSSFILVVGMLDIIYLSVFWLIFFREKDESKTLLQRVRLKKTFVLIVLLSIVWWILIGPTYRSVINSEINQGFEMVAIAGDKFEKYVPLTFNGFVLLVAEENGMMHPYVAGEKAFFQSRSDVMIKYGHIVDSRRTLYVNPDFSSDPALKMWIEQVDSGQLDSYRDALEEYFASSTNPKDIYDYNTFEKKSYKGLDYDIIYRANLENKEVLNNVSTVGFAYIFVPEDNVAVSIDLFNTTISDYGNAGKLVDKDTFEQAVKGIIDSIQG